MNFVNINRDNSREIIIFEDGVILFDLTNSSIFTIIHLLKCYKIGACSYFQGEQNTDDAAMAMLADDDENDFLMQDSHEQEDGVVTAKVSKAVIEDDDGKCIKNFCEIIVNCAPPILLIHEFNLLTNIYFM